MHTEIEAKFLDINSEIFRKKLEGLKASLVTPERLMKRKIFDFKDGQLRQQNGWVRVRDEGDKITLSYKQLDDRSLLGTKEINITVSNFDDTCDFLERIGMTMQSYQETKRESWVLDGVEVEIDTWPWIPKFVEIEGKSEEAVRNVSTKLELDWKKALHGSVELAYQAYFDVSEEEIDNWEEITFVPTPDWLEAKSIKNKKSLI